MNLLIITQLSGTHEDYREKPETSGFVHFLYSLHVHMHISVYRIYLQLTYAWAWEKKRQMYVTVTKGEEVLLVTVAEQQWCGRLTDSDTPVNVTDLCTWEALLTKQKQK